MPTLRSATTGASPAAASTPRSVKRRLTSPDASRHTSPHRSPHAGAGTVCTPKLLSASPKSSRKRLYGDLVAAEKPKWNPRGKPLNFHFSHSHVFALCWGLMANWLCHADPAQMRAVKEALHVATVPSCELMGMETPDSLTINCTNLANTSEIFSKILGQFQNRKKGSGKLSPLQQLQSMFSNKESAPRRMMLVIADEMDYLITRDRAVLHDLFMLTTCPYSRCILIGIANAIDLADRFLPKLESLNCKPLVVTFRAYSKDQISDIIKHRLKVLEYDVFEPLALEFCARKVAAATGDMRKALGVCRSAVEVLEAKLQDSSDQELGIVTFDHMDIALSKAFKSAVVDSILCLPQQQQMVLCALANTFQHCKKKSTTLGELNKSYIEICRSTQVPAVGMLEFSNMCMILSDQGFMKLGQSKEEKLRRVTLQIDISDIGFAFKVRAKVLNPIV
ncbi:hypothetical protein C2845_PM13G14930 [Panicum miliaceum]|uniref:Cdc6 C-terminal domain-containing protein n=1 Tax=Panicum miliaceum TaxID=4540 RepID=A0A3L6RI09_PANMI|nr:hypothetical protein C2845_PM13G14930 [Panicum miliaceum]